MQDGESSYPNESVYLVTVVFVVHDRSGTRSGSGLNALIAALSVRTVPGITVGFTFTVTTMNSSPNLSMLPTLQLAVPAANVHGVLEHPLVREQSEDATYIVLAGIVFVIATPCALDGPKFVVVATYVRFAPCFTFELARFTISRSAGK